MSRASTLIVLGALNILVPFSGFPSALRTLLAIGLGAAVLGIGVAARSREQRALVAAQSSSAVLESASPAEPSTEARTPTISPI